MSAMFSDEVVKVIDRRWKKYGYDRNDVVAMVARSVHPRARRAAEPTVEELRVAETLLTECD